MTIEMDFIRLCTMFFTPRTIFDGKPFILYKKKTDFYKSEGERLVAKERETLLN